MEILVAVLSLLFSMIAIGVAYYSFHRTHKTSIQPILVFSNEVKSESQTCWYVENVGNGPALNVFLASGDTDCNWSKDGIILMPAIARGGRESIWWANDPGALLAMYVDAFGREYTSVCVHSRNRISEGRLYQGFEPNRYLYQIRGMESKS